MPWPKNASNAARLRMSKAVKLALSDPKIRAKISVGVSGKNHPMYGKHHSAKTRAKMSASNRGQHRTEETCKAMSKGLRLALSAPKIRAKMSASAKLRFADPRNNPMYGKVPYHTLVYSKNLKHYVRSGWEETLCKFLKSSNIRYEYESTRFKVGKYTWTPDITFNGKLYLEIKGYLTKHAKWQILRFLQSYPDKTLIIFARLSKIQKFKEQILLRGFTNVIFLHYDSKKEWQSRLLEILKEQDVNT